MYFIGKHVHSLDSKGRVAIPHKFRDALGGANGGRVILTISPSSRFSYLDAYPADEWKNTIRKILDTPIPGPDPSATREAFLANYIHPAEELTLDAQGRILIPTQHRESAGLTKEIIFTGDTFRFRLWAPAEHARYSDATAKDKDKVQDIPGIWV
jgi:MraZ protein